MSAEGRRSPLSFAGRPLKRGRACPAWRLSGRPAMSAEGRRSPLSFAGRPLKRQAGQARPRFLLDPGGGGVCGMDQADRGRLIELTRFAPGGGHCFIAPLADVPPGDREEDPFGSPLVLFEDGIALGPPHSLHAGIREAGGGRYSHWKDSLYLSASDNSDPRVNRRRYQIYVPAVRSGAV